jgi:hypothetical protein
MRKKGENRAECAATDCDSAPDEMMVSRLGVESQTARYFGSGSVSN